MMTKEKEKLNLAKERGDFREILHRRLVALQYEEDDTGGGSALASITAAAATLGSAAIIASSQPNTVSAPQVIRPTGTFATSSGSLTLIAVLVAIVAGIALFMKS